MGVTCLSRSATLLTLLDTFAAAYCFASTLILLYKIGLNILPREFFILIKVCKGLYCLNWDKGNYVVTSMFAFSRYDMGYQIKYFFTYTIRNEHVWSDFIVEKYEDKAIGGWRYYSEWELMLCYALHLFFALRLTSLPQLSVFSLSLPLFAENKTLFKKYQFFF